jgi:Xaa-Pro aminopeptidase
MLPSHRSNRTPRLLGFVLAITAGAFVCRSEDGPGSRTLLDFARAGYGVALATADDRSQWDALPPISRDEFVARRAKVYEGIGEDIAVLCGFYAGPNEYRRPRQHNNFYYLTGVETPNCALLLDGRAKQATLFVPGRNRGPIESGPVTDRTGIEGVVGTDQFNETIKAAATGRKRVFMLAQPDEGYSQSRDSFFEARVDPKVSIVPGDPWILRAKVFRDGVKELVGDLEVANLQPIIDPLRRVKSPAEIERMRRAARIGAMGIADAVRASRPGILERELEGACEHAFLREGAHGSAWTSIVATGPKITEFHYFENSRRIQPGEMILVDAGPDYQFYCSDITRVWPVSGPYPSRYRELYDKLLAVHRAMIDAIKPGITFNDLNRIMRETAKAQEIDSYLVGIAGHFTGMAPHDVGSTREPFVPGVIFNVEPLIVVRGENLHIRFEDTVLCTETGHEVLTPLDILPWEADKLIEMRDSRPATANREGALNQ